jgi:hypothetical protein
MMLLSSLQSFLSPLSVYFITVSVTTVGYGYFHPSTDGTKLFTIFYVIVGVTLIISFVSTFARTVLTDAQDEFISFLHSRLLGYSDPPSAKQRARYYTNLSLASTLLCLLVGTLFYSGNEGWSTLDGLYWAVCTMTTVGYGQ